jgi:hypothetical protein
MLTRRYRSRITASHPKVKHEGGSARDQIVCPSGHGAESDSSPFSQRTLLSKETAGPAVTATGTRPPPVCPYSA